MLIFHKKYTDKSVPTIDIIPPHGHDIDYLRISQAYPGKWRMIWIFSICLAFSPQIASFKLTLKNLNSEHENPQITHQGQFKVERVICWGWDMQIKKIQGKLG